MATDRSTRPRRWWKRARRALARWLLADDPRARRSDLDHLLAALATDRVMIAALLEAVAALHADAPACLGTILRRARAMAAEMQLHDFAPDAAAAMRRAIAERLGGFHWEDR